MKKILVVMFSMFSGISFAQTQVNAFSLPQNRVIHEKQNATFWMIEDGIQKNEAPLPPLNYQVQTASECDPSLGDCLNPKTKQRINRAAAPASAITAPVQNPRVQAAPLVTTPPSTPANTLPAPAPRQSASSQEPPPPSLPK